VSGVIAVAARPGCGRFCEKAGALRQHRDVYSEVMPRVHCKVCSANLVASHLRARVLCSLLFHAVRKAPARLSQGLVVRWWKLLQASHALTLHGGLWHVA